LQTSTCIKFARPTAHGVSDQTIFPLPSSLFPLPFDRTALFSFRSFDIGLPQGTRRCASAFPGTSLGPPRALLGPSSGSPRALPGPYLEFVGWSGALLGPLKNLIKLTVLSTWPAQGSSWRPGWPQMHPTCPQMTSQMAHMTPRWVHMSPEWPPDKPKWHLGYPKINPMTNICLQMTPALC
jgi:hypothetical protein